MINPVVISVFWDNKSNGMPIDSVQIIDNTKYFWRSYADNQIVKMSILEFLEHMKTTKFSQMNFSVNNIIKFKDDSSVFSFIEDENLRKFVAKEYLKDTDYYHKELSVIVKCPICGRYKNILLRSIKSSLCFVCTGCKTHLGGSSFKNKGVYLSQQVDNSLEKYWDKNNRASFKTIQPLCLGETYNIICPKCGKHFKKSYTGILKTGFICVSCINTKNSPKPVKKKKTLRFEYPLLADMWDAGCNKIGSDKITPGSTIRGKFVCNNGGKPHYYIRTVGTVVAGYKKNSSTGCPICANKQVFTGVNDFATLYPELVKDWDYERNSNKPEETLCSLRVNIAFICPRCGRRHTKEIRSLKDRNFGSLCNSCARIISMRVSGKASTLREMYPDIADMLDNAPNAQKSDYLSPTSNGYYNFYCNGKSRGLKPHIFNASLSNVVACRDTTYHGCPVCAGRQVVTGVNDFKTLNPVGASMWNYRLNGVLPEEVYAYSPEMYHFICKNDHHFTRDPLHMMHSIGSSTDGCPVCYGRRVIVGINDLGTKLPFTLQKWDYDLNDFTPKDVTEGSNRKMLARCQVKSCSNVYETNVYLWSHNLVRRCPDCRKSQISTDEQNIADKLYSWGCAVEQQYPIAGGKYLLDAYLYKQNIAIEYNGVYWHSANKRGRDYHLDKYETAKKFGIDLYYIWSDDYESKPDLVINLLKQKVFDIESEFSPEDCTLSFIDHDEANSFIEENSLLDFNSYSFKGEYEYLGIYIGETLSAVCQLREVGEDTIEIFGYCEKFIVPNRVGMLEKFIKTNTGYHIMRVVHERASILDILDKVGVLSGDVSPRGFYVLGTKRSIELPSYLDKEEYNGKSIEQISLDTGLEIVYNAGYEVWEKQL